MVQLSAIASMTTPAGPVSFSSLGLPRELTDVVTALGYEEPTPVQRETIPLLLEGRDLLGQAATGTGKTAAFALPMLQRINEDRPHPRQTAGLVLVPTRELAMQVAEAIHKYAKGVRLSVLPVYGGAPMHGADSRARARRANRHRHSGPRAGSHPARHAEAGFAARAGARRSRRDARHGFRGGSRRDPQATPASRQTALFSATMPARILSIAERHLKDPARITIAREKTAAGKMPRVRQVAYIISRAQKPATLERILDMEDPVATLVFCRTRLEVESLVETCSAHGHRAEALHGGMLQKQRDRVMGLFRAQKASLAHCDRCRRARARHRAHLSRGELRRAGIARGLPAPGRADGPCGTRWHGDHPGGAARAASPARHRAAYEIEARSRQGADGRRSSCAPARADARVAARAAGRGRFRRCQGGGGVARGGIRPGRYCGCRREDGPRRRRRSGRRTRDTCLHAFGAAARRARCSVARRGTARGTRASAQTAGKAADSSCAGRQWQWRWCRRHGAAVHRGGPRAPGFGPAISSARSPARPTYGRGRSARSRSRTDFH